MPGATTAGTEGPEWSARAAAWTELWGALAAPAREAVADATALGPGMRVLDVGCGSGQFCHLAADRGAAVSGIDAAENMIGIARRLVPGADLRVGAMEALPWEDAAFDVVTGFNAFQFAADLVGALREAGRVARPGGRVVACGWGRPEDRELGAVFDALRELEPPEPPEPPTPPIEQAVRAAGLEPVDAREVDVAYAVPDRSTFEQPDGSYRFQNRFRYLVAARRPPASPA